MGVQQAGLGKALDRAVRPPLGVDQTEQHVHVVGRRIGADDVRPHIELHQARLLQREGLGVRQGGEDRLLQLQRHIGPALRQAVQAHADAGGADRRLALVAACDGQAVGRGQNPAGRTVGVGLGDQDRRRHGMAGRGDDVQMLDRHPRMHGPAGGAQPRVRHAPARLLQPGDLRRHPGLDLTRQDEPPAGPQDQAHGDDGEGDDQALAAMMRCGVGHENSRVRGPYSAWSGGVIRAEAANPLPACEGTTPSDRPTSRRRRAPPRPAPVPAAGRAGRR
ncbi:hypothetical protein D3C73_818300 [compost metagenome]